MESVGLCICLYVGIESMAWQEYYCSNGRTTRLELWRCHVLRQLNFLSIQSSPLSCTQTKATQSEDLVSARLESLAVANSIVELLAVVCGGVCFEAAPLDPNVVTMEVVATVVSAETHLSLAS